jgi:hypothetical protein
MWSLPTTPQMTIVGQNTGILTGPASSTSEIGTIKLSSGDLYIRGLSITGGSPGIWATGGILRLDHVMVSNNTAGGILLDGAGFDIKNTTVNNNGPNLGANVFGGIRIQSPTTPKSVVLSTVTGNGLIGVTCDSSAAVSPIPTNVLVSGNTGGDIATCGFSSCGTASTTCGAQP